MKKISLVSGLLCTALVFGCGDDGKQASATNATTNPTQGSQSGPTSDSDGTDSVSSTGNSTDTTSAGSNSDSDPSASGTTAVDPTTGDGTTMSFISMPDVPGGVKECDPWTQDCPAGEKCMPYSGDGDSSWESLKCTPVNPNPGQTGDPCTVEGSGVSGIDTCDVGHMCWNLDPDTGEGTCVKFCTGSPDAPMCDVPMTACTIANDGVLILCLPMCDPLTQNCEGGDLCIPNPMDPNSFICVLDASGEEGQEFDPCEYANACDPGFVCLAPTVAMECDPMALGCCTAFCDTTNAQCVGAGTDCVPWYEMGMAPPGFENVGVCALPG